MNKSNVINGKSEYTTILQSLFFPLEVSKYEKKKDIYKII